MNNIIPKFLSNIPPAQYGQLSAKRSHNLQLLPLALIICVSIFLTLMPSSSVLAISEEQAGAISQHCGTIKQSLTQLQRADSRTRTYLGTTYETIINKFITPLNLRLVKNNFSPLTTLQANFISEQNRFKESYTDYMRELENLIATDCQAQPQDFYSKLQTVRSKRSTLHKVAINMSKLAEEQYSSVQKIREEL